MKIGTIIDLITYLIASIAIIPLIKYIPSQYIAAALFSGFVSIKFTFKRRFFLNVLSIIFVFLSLLNISMENFIIPILNALIILISVKFLENKEYRDYMQIYLISLLLLAGFALLSVSITFLFYLIIMLILLSLATIFLTYFDEDKNLFLNKKDILTISYKTFFIFLLSLPIALFIFIILPRVETPFFNLFNNSNQAVTGFSDKIQLGDVTAIQEDDSVVFRVEMEKISEKNLYWRGIVLSRFNGKTWEKNIEQPVEKLRIKGKYRKIKQLIYLEPYYNKYLFALDKPVEIDLKKVKKFKNLTFEYCKNINKRLKYKAYSIATKNYKINKIDRKIYLQLPENLPEKLLSLKRRIKTISDIKTFFKNQNLTYTLKGLPFSQHPTTDFLFKTKKGNCEYFASAFAILLRLIKIPSRIIAGYKGGIYSNLGNYYIVTQKDAHVWVEAYIKKRWVRIDPVNFAKNRFQANNIRKYLDFKLILDFINYFWITHFINYDFNTQFQIFKKIAYLNFNKKFLKIFFKFLCYGILLFFLLFIVFKLTKQKIINRKDKGLIEIFLNKLEKSGYKRKSNESLYELIDRIDDSELKFQAEKFVSKFYEIYFTDTDLNKKRIAELKEILKWLPRPDSNQRPND